MAKSKNITKRRTVSDISIDLEGELAKLDALAGLLSYLGLKSGPGDDAKSFYALMNNVEAVYAGIETLMMELHHFELAAPRLAASDGARS